MTYIERYNGGVYFLNDAFGRALFMHTECGTTVWRDHSDPSRECTMCGRDYREQAWTQLFSGHPVVMERPEPPQDGHVYECCGKVGRISRHETWCPIMKEATT